MKFDTLLKTMLENYTVTEYSCLMLDINFILKDIEFIQKQICTCEIYDSEPGHGLEKSPHITVKYGIHSNKLHDITSKVDLISIPFTIKDVSLFENNDYDVLKLGIISPELRKLNRHICDKIECTDHYSEYNPHSTIAYLMPGCGRFYRNVKTNLIGKKFVSNAYIFSNQYRDITHASAVN